MDNNQFSNEYKKYLYELGKREGYALGKQEGYKEGYEDGKKQGYVLGRKKQGKGDGYGEWKPYLPYRP